MVTLIGAYVACARYATLPNIMKAKKKPIAAMTPEDLGVEVKKQLHIKQVGSVGNAVC